MNELINNV